MLSFLEPLKCPRGTDKQSMKNRGRWKTGWESLGKAEGDGGD